MLGLGKRDPMIQDFFLLGVKKKLCKQNLCHRGLVSIYIHQGSLYYQSKQWSRWFKVTFLSPNVGGHQQPFTKGHVFTIPKRSPAELLGDYFCCVCCYILPTQTMHYYRWNLSHRFVLFDQFEYLGNLIDPCPFQDHPTTLRFGVKTCSARLAMRFPNASPS